MTESLGARATESQDACQSPGERARLGRTATCPRGVIRKNVAGGRWGFKMSGTVPGAPSLVGALRGTEHAQV
jgi:hypothetical protein